MDIHAAAWRLNAHRDVAKLHQHVHLCLEGVPLNGWTEDLVARIIGDDCAVHFFDVASVRKEDAATLNVWAWTSCPSKVPKICWLTIIDGQTAAPEVCALPPGPGRVGLEGRVLIHLDVVDDWAPAADGSIPRRPRISEPFPWRLNLVDGERQPQDRRDREPPREREHRRRDDEDEDRRRRDGDDRRGRGDVRTWAQRFFRSRSRPNRGQDEERGRDRRGGQRRDESRGERRRQPSLDARSVDPRCEQLLQDGSVIPVEGRHPAVSPCPPRRGRTPSSSSARSRCRSATPKSATCASPASTIKDGTCCETPAGSPSLAILPSPPPRPTRSSGFKGRAVCTPLAILRRQPCGRLMWRRVAPVASPSPVPAPSATPDDQAQVDDETEDKEDSGAVSPTACTRLFLPRTQPLLQEPSSPCPRPLTTRRKTLAGPMAFPLLGSTPRSSTRLGAKKRSMPIAQLAEMLLCKRLGIIGEEEEQATEAVIAKFVQHRRTRRWAWTWPNASARFQNQLRSSY